MSIYNYESPNNVHIRAGEVTAEDIKLFDPVSGQYLRPLVRDNATPVTLPSYVKEDKIQFTPTAVWDANSTQNVLNILQGLTWDSANSRILQTKPQYSVDTAGNTTLAYAGLLNLQNATNLAYISPFDVTIRGLDDNQEVAQKKDGIWLHSVVSGGGHDSTKPSIILSKTGFDVRATNDTSNVTLSATNLTTLQRLAANTSATTTSVTFSQPAVNFSAITSISDTTQKILTIHPTTKRLYYQNYPTSSTIPSYIQTDQILMTSSTTGASNLLLSTADNSLLSSIVGSTVSSVKIASGAATFSQQGYADAVLDASTARNLVKIGAVIKPSTTNPDRAVQINSVTYPGDALSIGSGVSIYDSVNSINYTRVDKNGVTLYNTGGTASKTVNYNSFTLHNSFTWDIQNYETNSPSLGSFDRSANTYSKSGSYLLKVPVVTGLSSGDSLEIKFGSSGLSSIAKDVELCIPFYVNDNTAKQVITTVSTNYPQIVASICNGVQTQYTGLSLPNTTLIIFRNISASTIDDLQKLIITVHFNRIGETSFATVGQYP